MPETDEAQLTPLESSVLAEYTRLNNNLQTLSSKLFTLSDELSKNPNANIADGLRGLERKTALVCTALKSSVYGIVLQQQIEFAEGAEGGGSFGNG